MFGKKQPEGVKYGEGKPFIHGKLLVNIFEAKDLPDMDNGKAWTFIDFLKYKVLLAVKSHRNMICRPVHQTSRQGRRN